MKVEKRGKSEIIKLWWDSNAIREETFLWVHYVAFIMITMSFLLINVVIRLRRSRDEEKKRLRRTRMKVPFIWKFYIGFFKIFFSYNFSRKIYFIFSKNLPSTFLIISPRIMFSIFPIKTVEPLPLF